MDTRDEFDSTPLIHAVGFTRCCSPKIVRLLIDAGADTASAVRFTDSPGGRVEFDGTLLAFAIHCLREKKVVGTDATEEQLNGLEGIRRLLLRVEAVHAVSWLWHNDINNTIGDAADSTQRGSASPRLRITLQTMRRRTRGRGVLLAALFRNSAKP